MSLESSPQYLPQQQTLEARRVATRPETMTDEQLLQFKKGLEWHVENLPQAHAQQEELDHVNRILEERERPLVH